MAENNGTYVLSGEPATRDGRAGRIWFSDDGLHWQLAAVPAEPNIDRIEAISSTSSGLIALGLDFGGRDAVTHALASGDGREWHYAGSFAGSGNLLAATGDWLVAFDYQGLESGPWYSDDGGTSWQWIESDSGRAVAKGLLALHAADGFVWAVRSDDPVEDATITTPVELWRTANGLDWELVTLLPDSISVNQAALMNGPNGWVMATRRTTFNVRGEQINGWYAWRSDDGINWELAAVSPAYVERIVGDGKGFIAIGREIACCATDGPDYWQHIWLSADGTTWRQMGQGGWHGREIDFITSVGDRVAGIGMDWLLAPGPQGEAWGVGWEVDRSELLP